MTIHVECLPDETLLKKGGFAKKQIKNHDGKSRVFADLLKNTNQFAMVDEDPGSAKTSYEMGLKCQKEMYGISFFLDGKRNNNI